MLNDFDRAEIASMVEASLGPLYTEPAIAAVSIIGRQLGPEQLANAMHDLAELADAYAGTGGASKADLARAQVVGSLCAALLGDSVRAPADTCDDPAIDP